MLRAIVLFANNACAMMSERAVVGCDIARAAAIVRNGGVIAYPTEFCFGFGCNPRDASAMRRLLAIKHRAPAQGVLLVASDHRQLWPYVDLSHAQTLMRDVWPGPVSLILPAHPGVSVWLRGRHQGVGCRVTRHRVVRDLCRQAGMAVVSTSANRHGSVALRSARQVNDVFGHQLDYIVDARVGGALGASRIIDVVSGRQLR